MLKEKDFYLKENNTYFSISSLLVPITLTIVLVSIVNVNFLLFHTLAEILFNNDSNHNLYLGGGYFWIGILDLFHSMSSGQPHTLI